MQLVTGHDVFRQALMLLNYTNNHGAVEPLNNAELHRRSLPIVNQIYADLWGIQSKGTFVPLASLADQIPLESYTLMNIMPYGVAMLVAQTDGDVDNQTLYATIYNQRRSAALGTSGRIEDRLPRTYL